MIIILIITLIIIIIIFSFHTIPIGVVLYIALVGNVFIIPSIYVELLWMQVFLYHTSLIGILSFLSCYCIISYPLSELSKSSRILYNRLFSLDIGT